MAVSNAHNKYNIIPIMIQSILWAEMGGATADVVLSAVPQAPHRDKRETLATSGIAENGDDSGGNETIYGINYPNTLYTAHTLRIQSLLSQPQAAQRPPMSLLCNEL